MTTSPSANPNETSPRPFVLIGMRGAGKSAVGRELARILGRHFVDLDAETLRFGRQAGRKAATVRALFEEAGEPWFREYEACALRKLLEPQPRVVIAAGGGTPEREDNRTWLRRAATVVWLEAGEETLRDRLAADPDARPAVLGEDALGELPLLLGRRTPLFRALADHAVAVEGKSPVELAQEIAGLLAPRPAEAGRG